MNKLSTPTNIFEYLTDTPPNNSVKQPAASTSTQPAASKYYVELIASVKIGVDEFMNQCEDLPPRRYNTTIPFIVCFRNSKQAQKARRLAKNGYTNLELIEYGYFFTKNDLIKINAYLQSNLRGHLSLLKSYSFMMYVEDVDAPKSFCDLS